MHPDDHFKQNEKQQELEHATTPLVQNLPITRRKLVAAIVASFFPLGLWIVAVESLQVYVLTPLILNMTPSTLLILVVVSCMAYEVLIRNATPRSIPFLWKPLALLVAFVVALLLIGISTAIVSNNVLFPLLSLPPLFFLSIGAYEGLLLFPQRSLPQFDIQPPSTHSPQAPNGATASKATATTLTRIKVALTILALLVAVTATSTASLAFELNRAADREARLRTDLAGAIRSNDRLQDRIGPIDSLEAEKARLTSEVARLTNEIADLNTKRRPLILRTETQGFACTGSMEPKITCLDTATALLNPSQDEIEIGATIAFSANSCWPDDGDYHLAHRVIDIEIRDGQNHYLTKGDAEPEPDCWVPHLAVDGYIIAIHKNSAPHNAGMRDTVNSARADYEAAIEVLEPKLAAYEASLQHLMDLRVRDGCPIPEDIHVACYAHKQQTAASIQWNMASIQYNTDARAFQNALQVFNEAERFYDCVYNSAERFPDDPSRLGFCLLPPPPSFPGMPLP